MSIVFSNIQNFIDLLSYNSTQIINDIYNLKIDSPTTIHFFYQNVIKNSIVNEIDVIIDIIKMDNINDNYKIDNISILIEDVKFKLDLLKKLIEKNENKDIKLILALIKQFEAVTNQIQIENSNIYIVDIENNVINYKDPKFIVFLELLRNSFNNIKVSVWNLYNQGLIDTPYFLLEEQNFIRETQFNDFIIFYLSDFINYELNIDWELVSYLLFYQEIQLKVIINYLEKDNSKEEDNSKYFIDNIIDILYNKDFLEQNHLDYIKSFVNFKNIQKIILNKFVSKIEKEDLSCIVCKRNKIDFIYFSCPECDIDYIDLTTNIDSIKLLFYLLILNEFELFYSYILEFRDYLYSIINQNPKIYKKLKILKSDLIYINQIIGKVNEIESIIKILDEIIQTLEVNKNKTDKLLLSIISKKLNEINSKLEIILFDIV